MAAIIKKSDLKFEETPNKIDNFRLLTDVSRIKKDISPENLNFDFRQLNPKEFSSPYHFHHNSEELFLIISGSATLRTPKGLEIVNAGDLIFFEKGESGAHQLHNHTNEPCIYLDIRTFHEYDVCEYPDSDKIYFIPTNKIFSKKSTTNYFDGEENVVAIWKKLQNKS